MTKKETKSKEDKLNFELKTVQVPIKQLKIHPDNPRQHTIEQVNKIAKSIIDLGWGRPIIISKDFYILAGHGATTAAKDVLKRDTVPCVMMNVEGMSNKAKAYMIADNKLTDESTWNYDKLAEIFEEMDTVDFDVSVSGFEVEEVDDLLAEGDIDTIGGIFDTTHKTKFAPSGVVLFSMARYISTIPETAFGDLDTMFEITEAANALPKDIKSELSGLVAEFFIEKAKKYIKENPE